MDDLRLDLRGLKCPLPVLRTRKLLGRLAEGVIALVECTDPLSAIDIPHLLRETGDELLGIERQDTVLIFRIRRRNASSESV